MTVAFLTRYTRPLLQAALAAALGAGAFAAAPALAAPPAALTNQVPGYYRQAVGDFTVTALYDGYVDLSPQLLKGMAADQVQSLLARMFIANSQGVQTAVNGYLVHTGDHLVLVDTGAAACFGPTLGQITTNLKAAGYAPEQVDTVLLTHLHPDHLCGLLDAKGQPVFPQATVYAAAAEAGFWLDPAVAAQAPAGNQPFFKMARDSVAPYQAAQRFKTFTPGQALLPGVSVLPSPGHTPGHSSYLFASKGQTALVWGDIVHSHAVQFAHPEVAIEFDVDSATAISSRKALFERAAREAWWVAGAHLPFPGLGHVRQEPQGYAWVPVEFGPVRTDR
jgi:glyoxylase-like metal-dependent hydrolase (beta-lactamase superfamily II)